MNNKENRVKKMRDSTLHWTNRSCRKKKKNSNSEESIKLEKFPKKWNETSGQ